MPCPSQIPAPAVKFWSNDLGLPRGGGEEDKKVLPLLRFNLMISGSAKIRYQQVRENYLRSEKNQGKIKENESGKKLPPCWN